MKFKSLVLFCLILMVFASLSFIQAKDVNDTSKISEDDESFNNLDEIINDAYENSTVSLKKDYTLYGDEITINKALTIDGNGHSLNGNKTSRIFYIQSDNVVIKNTNFINGRSEDKAGAVFFSIDSDNCTIVNCTFSDNYARDEGGAVYGSFLNNVRFINCTFKNNYANSGGSLNWYFGLESSITNCTFLNNSADYGGAIFCNSHDFDVVNSTFINNTADIYGGSVFWNGYGGKLFNCSFLNNSASVGGSIYWFGDEGILTKSSFINNHGENGGAICWDGFKGTASDCSFLNNSADEGGAIFWTGASGSLTDSNFTNNFAFNEGGAVWWDEEAINGLMFNCNFLNNSPDDVADFTIKIPTIITALNVKTTFGSGKLTVKLTSLNGSPLNGLYLTVLLNHKTYVLKTDSNGKAALLLNSLGSGSFTAFITFDGIGKYKTSSKFVSVVVKKASVKLTAKSKSFKKSIKIKKYSVILKTNLNKALKKVKVSLKVNKRTYVAKTNVKGKATFKITKLTKKGKFKSIVTFKGNKNYKKISKNVNIKVK